ncbi:hypothetical protein BD779DRAFT_1455129 [Infundibulicybe gibba]|nr:hypothetical protein BD779DRAFT_1455129 [Infundibulicybe gibba]
MATLVRFAKSGSEWTSYNLTAFNIQIIIYQDPISFFNVQELPTLQNISPVILNNVAAPANVQPSKQEQLFFSYLEDAMNTVPGEETFVKDFAAFLLGMFDYNGGHRVVYTREEIPFYMCGTWVKATAGVTVIERFGPLFQYLLLVQEVEVRGSGGEPEPPLVAEAIAAFRHNNKAREIRQMPLLKSQTFPAMTIARTTILFFRITVTQDLLAAIESGAYPTNATIVHQFIPLFPPEMDYFSKGMVPLESRRTLFQYLEAFKQFCMSFVAVSRLQPAELFYVG